MSEKQKSTVLDIRPGGFTLIELLVVISIMSMLMSILLPSLNRAREQGRRVVCLSNLKQLTLAWTMYAMDNEDRLCSPYTSWIDDDYGLPSGHKVGFPHWVLGGPDAPPLYQLNHIGDSGIAIKEGVLWPYIKSLDLYKCKSDRSDLLRNYSMSNTMGGDFAVGYSKGQPFKSLIEISRTAERMVFTGANSAKRWISNSFLPIYDIHTEAPWWAGPGGWPSAQSITARHNDGFNVFFADNHGEYWKWKDPRTVKTANREMNPHTASDDNLDLPRLIKVLKGK